MSTKSSTKLSVRLLLLALVTGTTSYGLAQPAVISTQTPTYGSAGSTLFIFLPITNTGGATAGSLRVNSATLGAATLLTPILPLAVGDVGPGGGYGLTLTFNASGLVVGKNYLLTVRGNYQTASGTLSFSVNRFLAFGTASPFTQSPNPVTVSPTLDSSDAVTEIVSAVNGGTMTATGADGSVFTLTIPPNALLSDESITMTPLTTVGGLPISGGFLAGVQLAPDGLTLQQPATLTILPAVQVPISQQVGFGYHSGGQEFYFQPLGLGNTISISLLHFSGAGVGQGSPGNGGTPTSPADQFQQQATQLINQERACQAGGGCNSNLAEELEGLLQEDYVQVVQPLAQQALTDDSVAQSALQTMLGWARQVQLLGFDQDSPFSAEVQTVLSQVPQILENVYNKAFGRCIADTSQSQRVAEAVKMTSAERSLQLLGSDPNPNFDNQIAACIAGPLDFTFDSTVNGTQAIPGGETLFSDSTVNAQQIPLTFDTGSFSYTGNGALNYQSHSYSIDWATPGVVDCSSGVGNSGTIGITAEFDLNVSPFLISNPNQIRLHVTLAPDVTESDTSCLLFNGVTASNSATTVDYDLYLGVTNGVAFAGGGSASPSSPYFVNLNTPAAFKLSGSTSQSGVIFSAQQASTITVTQTSP